MDIKGYVGASDNVFKNIPYPVILTNDKLESIWANMEAIKCYPTLAYPDGVTDLMRSYGVETIIGHLMSGELFTANMKSEPFNDVTAYFLPIIDQDFIGSIVFMSHENKTREQQQQMFDIQTVRRILASFSNEYKMPLTIIFSTLGLMARRLDDSQDDTMKNYLKLVTQNSYRLLRLSNNLSSVSSYRSGIAELKMRNGDICEFIAGICNASAILTAAAGIVLECDVPEKRIVIAFDPNRISVALLNLISNSCKYTKDNNTIKVRLEEHKEQIVITVSDRGKGIKSDMLDYIFEPYFSYDPQGRPFGGAGLGMSLVKYTIAMHGGTVAVKSREGEGTTVAFTLPKAINDDLPDYTASNGADYLADRFSPVYIQLSDVCGCPLP